MHTDNSIAASTDNGETWGNVRVDVQESPHINFSSNSKLAIAAGRLYGILPEEHNLRFFRLHKDDNIPQSRPRNPQF